MLRLVLVLLFGLCCEAMGVVLIAKGQKQLTPMGSPSVASVLRLVQESATNVTLISGVALEAVFFFCLLFLLSRADVSFVWPLSGLSFLFTTVAARWLLHEQVEPLRWCGVVLIVSGAMLIAYTEKARERARAAVPPAAEAP